MTGAEAISAIQGIGQSAGVERTAQMLGSEAAAQSGQPSFAQMMSEGIAQVDANVIEADNAVRSFVLDETMPVHQVTYALEQARMSLELMMQVRARLVEGYQQVMGMQL